MALRAADWLTERGHEINRVVSDSLPPDAETEERPGVRLVDDIDVSTGPVDVAISLGGDGTMLRTVAMCAPLGVPVLGVNLGRLGYLTEVEPNRLEAALERLEAGDYKIENRLTLDVSVQRATSEDGQHPEEEQAHLVLNEAVVERVIGGHTIRVATEIKGRSFVTYACDGLLVATPTGSTAYNLSLRGPILSPGLQAMVLTPISPHMLFDRPLVLEAEQWLSLRLEAPRPAHLVLDGTRVADLSPGDAVVCRSGKHPAPLITFSDRDFHSILRARFQLADR